jgi:hypothetical protein
MMRRQILRLESAPRQYMLLLKYCATAYPPHDVGLLTYHVPLVLQHQIYIPVTNDLHFQSESHTHLYAVTFR